MRPRTEHDVVTVTGPRGVVCGRCAVADSPLARLRGLLGRAGLGSDEGLLLRPSGSVHTCFMRFAIDVVFLTDELEVVGVAPAVGPWRARGRRGARAVLELPAGRAAGLAPGDRLRLEGAAHAG